MVLFITLIVLFLISVSVFIFALRELNRIDKLRDLYIDAINASESENKHLLYFLPEFRGVLRNFFCTATSCKEVAESNICSFEYEYCVYCKRGPAITTDCVLSTKRNTEENVCLHLHKKMAESLIEHGH